MFDGGDEKFTLTALIEVLSYIKDRPGHIPATIKALDEALYELNEDDNAILDSLVLYSGEIEVKIEHCHDKWCFKDGFDCLKGIKTITEKV